MLPDLIYVQIPEGSDFEEYLDRINGLIIQAGEKADLTPDLRWVVIQTMDEARVMNELDDEGFEAFDSVL